MDRREFLSMAAKSAAAFSFLPMSMKLDEISSFILDPDAERQGLVDIWNEDFDKLELMFMRNYSTKVIYNGLSYHRGWRNYLSSSRCPINSDYKKGRAITAPFVHIYKNDPKLEELAYRLAMSCVRMEESEVANLLLSLVSDNNAIKINKPLCRDALFEAISEFPSQKDNDGNTVDVASFDLIVPPNLAFQAMRDCGIVVGYKDNCIPVVRYEITSRPINICLNCYLPTVITNKEYAQKTWYLCARYENYEPFGEMLLSDDPYPKLDKIDVVYDDIYPRENKYNLDVHVSNLFKPQINNYNSIVVSTGG